jgi:mannose-6-phosphate isomerase-like protein (cupin superfamily)
VQDQAVPPFFPEPIAMDQNQPRPQSGRFDLNEIARSFPDSAETLLLDRYLTDQPSASARAFRVYKPTPPHYHANCDEHLYVLSGKGTFWIDSPDKGGAFGPGHLLFFGRNTVHALPEITEGPLVFLAVDTPRRDPSDVIFVDPADGTPQSFIRQHGY